MVSMLESVRLGPLRGTRGTVVASHQPNFIPWLGYFFKIAHCDKFVFVDSVMMPDRGFVNRNSIKTAAGPLLLTVPFLRSGRAGQLIDEVETDNVQPWVRRHLATIRGNYARAPHFREVFAILEAHYVAITGEKSSLAEFNMSLIKDISNHLCLFPQWIRSSDLDVGGAKTDLIVDICHAVRGATYLAGTGSRSYMEEQKLSDARLALIYSSFVQAPYPQLNGAFVPNLSIVDVLMNCGFQRTRELLAIGASQKS